MTEKDDFAAAQERVKALSRRPSNDELLRLYGFYKQALDGDATGSRPGILDPKGRAKFDAWSALRGTSPAESRKRYVALVEELVRKHG